MSKEHWSQLRNRHTMLWDDRLDGGQTLSRNEFNKRYRNKKYRELNRLMDEVMNTSLQDEG